MFVNTVSHIFIVIHISTTPGNKIWITRSCSGEINWRFCLQLSFTTKMFLFSGGLNTKMKLKHETYHPHYYFNLKPDCNMYSNFKYPLWLGIIWDIHMSTTVWHYHNPGTKDLLLLLAWFPSLNCYLRRVAMVNTVAL